MTEGRVADLAALERMAVYDYLAVIDAYRRKIEALEHALPKR